MFKYWQPIVSVCGVIGMLAISYGNHRVFVDKTETHLTQPCHGKTCEDIAAILATLNLLVRSYNAGLDGKNVPVAPEEIVK